eukprot:NODE_16848_length_974_cov_3.839433.p1 GENE.NODE_16848_length_974_cov_3.839433~~NODE_16848_length_974_cov_3.839433.p1  ORF type:complete len:226 (-),score=43.89 NODE_16848_length_974_cov_3.839433:245-922(-)
MPVMAQIRSLVQKCTGGVFGGGSDVPIILVLGLEGAGKTTLLYRLRLPNWDNIEEEVAAMRKPGKSGEVEDPGYHYEELTGSFRCGIFEVPGTDAMRRIWPAFYHAVKIHCVIFVVDSAVEDEARINLAKRHLHCLMHEDELQKACFIVLINLRDTADAPKYNKDEDPLYFRLGLHEVHASCAQRVSCHRIDVLKFAGEEDPAWKEVLKAIRERLQMEESFGMKL